MFDRRQLVARSAAIMLMFASFGDAQADVVNKYLAEVRADLEMADGVEISSKNRTDIRATADAGGDQPDVIEEIVVIGREKWQFPHLGSSLGTDPVVQKPSRIDWEFLPVYDPDQAYPFFDQFQLSEEIRRAGFIELFRVRFGR